MRWFLNVADSEVRQLASLLVQAGDPEELALSHSNDTSTSSVLQTAASRFDAATIALERAQASLAETEGSVQDLRRELDLQLRVLRDAETELSAASRYVQAAIEDWQRAGYPGLPDEDAGRQYREVLSAHKQVQAEMESRHREASRVMARFRDAEELTRVESEIAMIVQGTGCIDESGVAAFRTRQIMQCEKEIAAAKSARQERDRLIADLQNAMESFGAEVIRPLDELNLAYQRALSCFPDLRVRLGSTISRKDSELDLSLTQRVGSEMVPFGASASQFLSEGQLSALSVSLMLSLSVAYPWSRWPALVLDDPLQHNDIIHGAAFIDIIVAMVKERSYQVLLTTHDLELADFVRRKLVASDTRCVTCVLTGPGADGVEYRVVADQK